MSDWYQLVEGPEILQSDLIAGCPLLEPTEEALTDEGSEKLQIRGRVRTYDVVLVSQSCDLVQKKLRWVNVCTYCSLNELELADVRFESTKMKEEIRRGNAAAYHMLAAPFR